MSLTPEQIEAGWVEHDGGPCPVPLDSKPGVIFRGERWPFEPSGSGRVMARNWHWGLHGHLANIAYRPEPRP